MSPVGVFLSYFTCEQCFDYEDNEYWMIVRQHKTERISRAVSSIGPDEIVNRHRALNQAP